MPNRWMIALTSITLTGSYGCAPAPTRRDIASVDARRRVLAIRAAAQRHDLSAIPLLVDRLEDEDEAVRMFAILALEKLTGTRNGYVYYMPPDAQLSAIRRWRTFVRERAVAAAGHAPPVPSSSTAPGAGDVRTAGVEKRGVASR